MPPFSFRGSAWYCTVQFIYTTLFSVSAYAITVYPLFVRSIFPHRGRSVTIRGVGSCSSDLPSTTRVWVGCDCWCCTLSAVSLRPLRKLDSPNNQVIVCPRAVGAQYDTCFHVCAFFDIRTVCYFCSWDASRTRDVVVNYNSLCML